MQIFAGEYLRHLVLWMWRTTESSPAENEDTQWTNNTARTDEHARTHGQARTHAHGQTDAHARTHTRTRTRTNRRTDARARTDAHARNQHTMKHTKQFIYRGYYTVEKRQGFYHSWEQHLTSEANGRSSHEKIRCNVLSYYVDGSVLLGSKTIPRVNMPLHLGPDCDVSSVRH